MPKISRNYINHCLGSSSLEILYSISLAVRSSEGYTCHKALDHVQLWSLYEAGIKFEANHTVVAQLSLLALRWLPSEKASLWLLLLSGRLLLQVGLDAALAALALVVKICVLRLRLSIIGKTGDCTA